MRLDTIPSTRQLTVCAVLMLGVCIPFGTHSLRANEPSFKFANGSLSLSVNAQQWNITKTTRDFLGMNSDSWALNFDANVESVHSRSLSALGNWPVHTNDGFWASAAGTATASANVKVGPGMIRAEIGTDSSMQFTNGNARADLALNLHDHVSLMYRGPEVDVPLPFNYLNFLVRLEGEMRSDRHTYVANQGTGWNSAASTRIVVSAANFLGRPNSYAANSYSVNSGHVFDGVIPRSVNLMELFTVEGRIDAQNSAQYQIHFNLQSFAAMGHNLLRFGNSVTLAAILFPDGSTPESHGYELVFASGMSSPNLLDNESPVANAGDDQTVPCDGPHGTMILLDGSRSFDPGDDELEYEWSFAEDSGILIDDYTASVTGAFFPVGVHEVTLTVYDIDEQGERKGGLDLDSVMIIVVDATPPVALVNTNLTSLWPANNKMVPVVIHVVASDHCTDPDNLFVLCTITSNQPDNTGDSGEHVDDVDGHDGYMAPVAVALDPLGNGEFAAQVYLRAERDGNDLNGRIYSINIAAIDTSSNMGYATTTVVVPHNMRRK